MTEVFVLIIVVALVVVPTVWAAVTRPNRTAFNYKTLRTLVGLIAVSIAGVATWASARDLVTINSISASYHTGGQDLFVGSLLIVAAFLFAYEGDAGDRLRKHGLGLKVRGWLEFATAKVAAVSIATVALFPTAVDGCTDCTVPGYLGLPLSVTDEYHFAGAITFFLCLAVFLLVFLWRVIPKLKDENIKSSTLGISPFIRLATYAAGLSAIVIGGLIMAFDWAGARSVFWAEFLALTGFGVAWFVAGVQSDKRGNSATAELDSNA